MTTPPPPPPPQPQRPQGPQFNVPVIGLDVERAAVAMSMPPVEVEALMRRGEIRSVEHNGRLLTSPDALNKWLTDRLSWQPKPRGAQR